jgi:four helix bundle protein
MVIAKITSFRDLDAWQAAMELAVMVHRAAAILPASQRFELGAQLRKAATSVPSNIAEGHAQKGGRTFLRHVRIALGSLAEVDTQIELAVRLNFFTTQDVLALREVLQRSGQLLHGLERALGKRLQHLATAIGVAVTCISIAVVIVLA